jgi:hypothetical protein
VVGGRWSACSWGWGSHQVFDLVRGDFVEAFEDILAVLQHRHDYLIAPPILLLDHLLNLLPIEPRRLLPLLHLLHRNLLSLHILKAVILQLRGLRKLNLVIRLINGLFLLWLVGEFHCGWTVVLLAEGVLLGFVGGLQVRVRVRELLRWRVDGMGGLLGWFLFEEALGGCC